MIPSGLYSPFRNWYTVSLYPRKGTAKYLKFKTEEEQQAWQFIPGKSYRCAGCLHVVDGNDVVFDITMVERLGC